MKKKNIHIYKYKVGHCTNNKCKKTSSKTTKKKYIKDIYIYKPIDDHYTEHNNKKLAKTFKQQCEKNFKKKKRNFVNR